MDKKDRCCRVVHVVHCLGEMYDAEIWALPVGSLESKATKMMLAASSEVE